MTILVTGGAGFIGSNFVVDWCAGSDEPVVNLDALTYAGNLTNLAAIAHLPRHAFVEGDICDGRLVARLLAAHRPRAIVHLAAETHVDRSIASPEAFITSNVNGTFALLEAAREYWSGLSGDERSDFRFLHVSTDEVYGSLGPEDPPFSENSKYDPSSPYSASKAASDHLVRAWHRTFGLPTLITNCSNNYGPRQYPEKLIPLMIQNALAGDPLPVYGDGLQVRDWLYVGDHCAAVRDVLARGTVGSTYNIGGASERTNLDVVRTICALMDEFSPDPAGARHRLVAHVPDRLGHDQRYSVDARRIEEELGWRTRQSFESGLRLTVRWYLDNPEWVATIREKSGIRARAPGAA